MRDIVRLTATQSGLPRRVLAVLEGRATDDAVCAQAVAVAAASGGFLTLVSVVSQPWLIFECGTVAAPRVPVEYLRAHAELTLARAAARVPEDIPLLRFIEEGPVGEVIARRVGTAAHDLVVVRRTRLLALIRWRRPSRVPVLAVPAS